MSPRHPVMRVSDLLPTAAPARVRAVLAARGIPEGDRDVPLGAGVRAIVTATAAGVLVTFESRTGRFAPRGVVLRRLDEVLVTVSADVADTTGRPAATGGSTTVDEEGYRAEANGWSTRRWAVGRRRPVS